MTEDEKLEFVLMVGGVPDEVLADGFGVTRGAAALWRKGTTAPGPYMRREVLAFCRGYRAGAAAVADAAR